MGDFLTPLIIDYLLYWYCCNLFSHKLCDRRTNNIPIATLYIFIYVLSKFINIIEVSFNFVSWQHFLILFIYRKMRKAYKHWGFRLSALKGEDKYSLIFGILLF